MTPALLFRTITKDKQEFLPLLLSADPDVTMIERYLESGTMIVAYWCDTPACVAVVTRYSATCGELKALATTEQFQHQGIASAMIRHLFARFKDKYSSIIVGTAEPAVPFYQKFGFVLFRTEPDFFTRNYPTPVYDGDFLCRDMIYLRKDL